MNMSSIARRSALLVYRLKKSVGGPANDTLVSNALRPLFLPGIRSKTQDSAAAVSRACGQRKNLFALTIAKRL